MLSRSVCAERGGKLFEEGLPCVQEQAGSGIEADLDFAVSGLCHLSLTELGVIDPLSDGKDLFRCVGTQTTAGSLLGRGRRSNSASRDSRRARLLLLAEAMLVAAGTTDDSGGRAVRIQGDDLMCAFGFASSTESIRVVAWANSLDSEC